MLKDVHRDRLKILDEIARSISKALKNLSQQEPQLVANLIFHLTRDFNTKISGIFKKFGIDAKSGGVFVHQTPKVKFKDDDGQEPSCEIGDLLLIFTRKVNGNIKCRNALLLQAKKINSTSDFIEVKDKHQYYLYTNWPEFEYVHAPLKGNKRKINQNCNPGYYEGSKYLLIGSHSDYCSICSTSYSPLSVSIAYPTHPNLSRHRCFVEELYDSFFGYVGREFEYQPKNNIDWDQVITDLLDNVTTKASNLFKNAGDPSGSRSQGVLWFGDVLSILNGKFDKYPKYEGDEPPLISTDLIEEDNFGVSFVEFIFEDEGS